VDRVAAFEAALAEMQAKVVELYRIGSTPGHLAAHSAETQRVLMAEVELLERKLQLLTLQVQQESHAQMLAALQQQQQRLASWAGQLPAGTVMNSGMIMGQYASATTGLPVAGLGLGPGSPTGWAPGGYPQLQ
jgi:hypothetical protein